MRPIHQPLVRASYSAFSGIQGRRDPLCACGRLAAGWQGKGGGAYAMLVGAVVATSMIDG